LGQNLENNYLEAQEYLRIALIQSSLTWEDPVANHRHFEGLIARLSTVDLILLPEMFSTGFSMNPKVHAEFETGLSLSWMQGVAHDTQAAISGSLMVKEDNQYYNRLFFVYPNGAYKTYNKKHLFSLAGEEKVYTAGRERLVLNYLGWRINPQICYDLRFPVWCRNSENFDLQFFVANWPQRRSTAWATLLQARAIENQCFVAGVNRIGDDGNGVYHSGDSAVHNALGEKLCVTAPGSEGVEVVHLEYKHLQKVREKLNFIKDRDIFRIDE
jgi:omega-amidase